MNHRITCIMNICTLTFHYEKCFHSNAQTWYSVTDALDIFACGCMSNHNFHLQVFKEIGYFCCLLLATISH